MIKFASYMCNILEKENIGEILQVVCLLSIAIYTH